MQLEFVHAKGSLICAFKIYSEFAQVSQDLKIFNLSWENLPARIIEELTKKWEAKELPYHILIHELLHANDMLRGKQGSLLSEERHEWFDQVSKEIGKEIFGE